MPNLRCRSTRARRNTKTDELVLLHKSTGVMSSIKEVNAMGRKNVTAETQLHLACAITEAELQASHVGGMNGRWEFVCCGDQLSEVRAPPAGSGLVGHACEWAT